ncbi:MAG TPA: type I DNA topoisomerase [Ktedonobacterales bacterium]|nr:type I DNA topoisomerase [Ktedonobacterales bacterium]
MAKNLVIVESPAKAKTIEKFLGADYEVRASMGHIIDLPRNGLGVDVRHNFAPKYVTIEKKEALIADLKKASKNKTVYLAPDPDREGEFIAWSLQETLGLKKPKRAVFNEITKRAVQDAIDHPRVIDEDLFNAQQARRVLDRLVGYKISPLLWRRVQSGTSAGRVQSVAVRLICDREAEIRAFVPEEYWTITATLSKLTERATFTALLVGRVSQPEAANGKANGKVAAKANGDTQDEENSDASADANGETSEANVANAESERQNGPRGRIRIGSQEEAQALLRELNGATYRTLGVERRDVRRQPFLPYTTSTLQQDASVRLHFKPKRTMSLAQQLYEGIEMGEDGHQGLITYMRTDSTRISDEAQVAVKQYIGERFGQPYVGALRAARGKAKVNAQDAHEAIRATDVSITPERVKPYLTPDQFKLYQLVWRRFVAAFMTAAVFDATRIDIGAGDLLFRASGSTLKFPGFYAVWPREEDADALPVVEVGETLKLHKLAPDQHFTQAPPRFTEASLIKDLEERGIGRPSTFVPIVSTIQDRGYVEQQDRRFVPTWLGETVNELMIKHFGDIVDVNFTADMERRLDSVEEGKQVWTEFLKGFYAALREELSHAEAEMDRVQKPVEDANEACPECGKPLLIRTGRFGRFISCSGYPDCTFKKPFMTKTGAICPQDGGDLVERKSRKSAKVFYGCANFPTCNFAVWDRPLTTPCPECGGLLTLGNGKTEAACYQCGALVRGALEGTPEVVGHRTPEALRPRRTATDATEATGTDGAAPTRARRSASRAPAASGRAKTTRTTARTAASRTTKTATTARRTSSTTRAKATTAKAGSKTTGVTRARTTTTRTREPAAS